MPQEWFYLQQLFGAGSGLLQSVLFAGLLVVLIYRPEKIRQRTLFLWSCCTLALSIAAPPFWNVVFSVMGAGPFGGSFGRGGGPILLIGSGVIGPGLLAISLLFALLSLLPRRGVSCQPPKHPLE
jgi:hypothetical protein